MPSPNVAEDHQTKNALALVNNEAAILVSDVEAPEKLISTAIALLTDDHKQAILINNIGKMAMLNADVLIANEVIKIISA